MNKQNKAHRYRQQISGYQRRGMEGEEIWEYPAETYRC